MSSALRTSASEPLSDRLLALGELIPPGSRVAYFDIPFHYNIGDLLIYLGAETWFAQHGVRVVGRYNIINFDAAGVAPGDIICVHGGGNFGDLYPANERLRSHVIERFPDHRIVVLPQSAHFAGAPAPELIARYAAHRDLTVCSRDPRTYELLTGTFKVKSLLLPDMAHALHPLEQSLPFIRTGGATGEMYFLRRDKEQGQQPQRSDATDWRDYQAWPDHLLYQCLRFAFHGDRRLFGCRLNRLLHGIWTWQSLRLARRMARAMDAYDTIVTSRLHGSILAHLLGKQVRLYDNSYGKNSAYARSWTIPLGSVQLVADP